jgi:hypothetical protein
MMVMATFAAWLAVAVPGQISNLGGAVFTFYLVATAWLTVRRPEGAAGRAEKIALATCLLVLAAGFVPLFSGAAPPTGPLLIATFVVTGVVVIAAIGDIRLVMAGGVAGASRIARHLWRMCAGLTFATGSAFTNGLPRLLPGPMHVPGAFFLPMLVPIALLVFWMIRVRMKSWRWSRRPVTA